VASLLIGCPSGNILNKFSGL